MAMTAGGKAQKQAVPLKVTLVRPNKVDIDTGLVRLMSDGTTLTTSMIPLKRYMAAPAPQKIDIDTFREGPIGAALFGGPSGVPMFVLLNLLIAADPSAAIAQIGGSLQLAGVNGPKADGAKAGDTSLLIDLGKGAPGVLLTVDPATKLLSSIDLKVAPDMLAGRDVSDRKTRLVRPARSQPRSPRIGRLLSRPPRASRRSTHCSVPRKKHTPTTRKWANPPPISP